jgi:hypothetical protein
MNTHPGARLCVATHHLERRTRRQCRAYREHGLTVDNVEHVLANYEDADISRSSGLPCVFGYTPDGTYILVVYELLDADTIYPITAYAVPEP